PSPAPLSPMVSSRSRTRPPGSHDPPTGRRGRHGPAGKSGPGNVVPSLTKGGKLLRRVGENGAPSRRRRSRTRSCRSCLGGQRGLYLAAAPLDVAAGPVPDGQSFATAGSAPLAGGVGGAGGPARSGAADHRVSSGQ